MLKDQIFLTLRAHKIDIEKFGVRSMAIFGSILRGEENENSDIDLLIDFDPKRGLFVFIDLKQYLEEILAREVDLVTYRALHPALKSRIIDEAEDVF